MLHPCSLMLDPARIWRQPIPPFLEDGAPATALQVAADEHGLRLIDFLFIEDCYLLHLGRGTLGEVADGNLTSNRYYDWAVDHRDYHVTGQATYSRRKSATSRQRIWCLPASHRHFWHSARSSISSTSTADRQALLVGYLREPDTPFHLSRCVDNPWSPRMIAESKSVPVRIRVRGKIRDSPWRAKGPTGD